MPSHRPDVQSPASAALGSARGRKDLVPTKMLWICDGCFKYMKSTTALPRTASSVRNTHPPVAKSTNEARTSSGRSTAPPKSSTARTVPVWQALHRSQDHLLRREPFMFYVLTDAANASFDHPLGSFRRRRSRTTTTTSHASSPSSVQRKSFGTLMIEFSYYLSAAQGMWARQRDHFRI